MSPTALTIDIVPNQSALETASLLPREAYEFELESGHLYDTQ